MSAQRHLQGDRRGGHRPAGHGPQRPQGMERVDHRAAQVPLDPQAVGVLGDVGERIEGTGGQQREREPQRARCPGGREQARRGEHGAEGGDGGRAESPDQCAGGEPGEDRPGGEGREREAVDRVLHPQLLLHLRIAGQQVRQQRAVGEEQCADGDARATHGRGGVGDSHAYERTQSRVGASSAFPERPDGTARRGPVRAGGRDARLVRAWRDRQVHVHSPNVP